MKIFDRIKLYKVLFFPSALHSDGELLKGKLFVLYKKILYKIKWTANQEEFIKFHDMSSNFENKFLGEFSRHFQIFPLHFSQVVRKLKTK